MSLWIHRLLLPSLLLSAVSACPDPAPSPDMRPADGMEGPTLYDLAGATEPEECKQCSHDKPVCQPDNKPSPCRECNPGEDEHCQRRGAERPICEGRRCVACRMGSKDGDCGALPGREGLTCKGSTCVPCEAHGECSSGVCDVGAGKCVARSDVLHVDKSKPCPGDGEEATPYCDLRTALMSDKLKGSRFHVRVRASGTVSYGAIAVPALPRVAIYGEDQSGGVVQLDGKSTGAALSVSGGEVLLDSVEVVQGRPGVACTGAATKLTLRRLRVLRAAQVGLQASDCTIAVERSLFSRNNNAALLIEGAAKYSIVNNFIVDNNTEGRPAVQLSQNASGTFLYNTVANNVALVGVPGGIDCSSVEHALSESIFFGNSAPTIMGRTSQLFRACKLTNVVVGAGDEATGTNVIKMAPNFVDAFNVDPTKRNYSLQAGSPAINQAADTSIKVDYFGKPRPGPGNPAPDIGAHERQ